MEKILNKIKFYTEEEQAWFYFWYERFKRTGKIEYPSYVDGEDIPQGMIEIMDDDTLVDEISGNTYEQVKYGDDFFTGNLIKSSRTYTNKDELN